jgi:hypothetical protein
MLLLALWGGLMVFAFALIYHGLGPRFQATSGQVGFGTLLYMSGSTFLTLGLGDLTTPDPAGRLFMVLEAGSGFTFLALVITYMPVLHQAYAAREVGSLLILGSSMKGCRRAEAIPSGCWCNWECNWQTNGMESAVISGVTMLIPPGRRGGGRR